MEMFFVLAASAIVSYVVGGINGAIVFSRIVYHEDIRKKGSGNPGFTNFKRVYGLNAITWLVLATDFLKTALPVFVTALVMSKGFDMWQLGAAYAGLFCMLGHCFPVWYGFKGGKAFIAGFATTWFVDYRMSLIALVVFFTVLTVWKYMSVASCTASVVCPVAIALLGCSSGYVLTIVTISALLVVVRHKSNFVKLMKGTESKFSYGRSKQAA